jgi:hypothetical protein
VVDNNKCKRCGEVETYRHLLWECREAEGIWKAYNEFATINNKQEEKIENYETIFNIEKFSDMCKKNNAKHDQYRKTKKGVNE